MEDPGTANGAVGAEIAHLARLEQLQLLPTVLRLSLRPPPGLDRLDGLPAPRDRLSLPRRRLGLPLRLPPLLPTVAPQRERLRGFLPGPLAAILGRGDSIGMTLTDEPERAPGALSAGTGQLPADDLGDELLGQATSPLLGFAFLEVPGGDHSRTDNLSGLHKLEPEGAFGPQLLDQSGRHGLKAFVSLMQDGENLPLEGAPLGVVQRAHSVASTRCASAQCPSPSMCTPSPTASGR